MMGVKIDIGNFCQTFIKPVSQREDRIIGETKTARVTGPPVMGAAGCKKDRRSILISDVGGKNGIADQQRGSLVKAGIDGIIERADLEQFAQADQIAFRIIRPNERVKISGLVKFPHHRMRRRETFDIAIRRQPVKDPQEINQSPHAPDGQRVPACVAGCVKDGMADKDRRHGLFQAFLDKFFQRRVSI